MWLQPIPLYALGPLEGLRIRRLISRVAAFAPPEAAPHWRPAETEATRRASEGDEPVPGPAGGTEVAVS